MFSLGDPLAAELVNEVLMGVPSTPPPRMKVRLPHSAIDGAQGPCRHGAGTSARAAAKTGATASAQRSVLVQLSISE